MESEVEKIINYEDIGQSYLASQVKDLWQFISINKILYKENQEVELDDIVFQSLLNRDRGMLSEANVTLGEDGAWQAYVRQKVSEQSITERTCSADLIGEIDMHFTPEDSFNDANSLEQVIAPNNHNKEFADRNLALDSYRSDNYRNENIYSSMFYPSDSENWVCWIAAKVVEDWRDLNPNSISPEIVTIEINLSRATEETILNHLDKYNNSKLLSVEIVVRIAQMIEAIKKVNNFLSLNLKEKLDEQVRELVDWFEQNSASSSYVPPANLSPKERIHLKKQELSSQRRAQLERTYLKLKNLGSRALLNWMNKLDELLVESLDYYEQKRSECQKNEDSSRKAYYTLIKDLNKVYRFQTDWQTIKLGLNSYFTWKLKIEWYYQICRLLDEAREQVRGYIDLAIGWDEYLENLQNWFRSQCLQEPLFAPMLEKHRHDLDAVRLLRELEKAVGFSFNKWLSLNPEQNKLLKQQLILKLQPFCSDLYKEYCQQLKNVNTNSQSFLREF